MEETSLFGLRFTTQPQVYPINLGPPMLRVDTGARLWTFVCAGRSRIWEEKLMPFYRFTVTKDRAVRYAAVRSTERLEVAIRKHSAADNWRG